jgi:hypothetical protein
MTVVPVIAARLVPENTQYWDGTSTAGAGAVQVRYNFPTSVAVITKAVGLFGGAMVIPR